MNERMNGLLHSDKACFLLGSLPGAAVFVLIWGVIPLNPLNLDWILTPFGSDFCTTLIGALRYMKEGWTFPIGSASGLEYPSNTSIVFFDAIPFFAIFG